MTFPNPQPGKEKVLRTHHQTGITKCVHYSYRTQDGQLFTSLAPDLITARRLAVEWFSRPPPPNSERKSH